MKTLLIILLVLAVVAGIVYAATKYFKAFKDLDNDGIPDVVEDKFEEVKDKVEDKFEDVKEHVEDIKEDLEDFLKDVKYLPKKITRKKPGRSKKPATTTTKTEPKTKGTVTRTKASSTSDYYKNKR